MIKTSKTIQNRNNTEQRRIWVHRTKPEIMLGGWQGRDQERKDFRLEEWLIEMDIKKKEKKKEDEGKFRMKEKKRRAGKEMWREYGGENGRESKLAGKKWTC